MFVKGSVCAALGICVVIAYLALGTGTTPVCGQRVPDEVAAETRGGCTYYDDVSCDNPGGDGCSSCTKLVSGDHKGKGEGNCYCASGCGSFWENPVACAE
jgi:hypothetical protein